MIKTLRRWAERLRLWFYARWLKGGAVQVGEGLTPVSRYGVEKTKTLNEAMASVRRGGYVFVAPGNTETLKVSVDMKHGISLIGTNEPN